jgi:hypothetical protein
MQFTPANKREREYQVGDLTASRSAPAACTIVMRNFLSYARVLGASYLREHPGSRFYVLVADRLPDGVEVGEGLELVDPDALGLPYFHELCEKYKVVELSNALKPALLSYLLERHDEAVYLDADILVMRPLTELWSTLQEAPIVLTPHILSPIAPDGLRPNEEDMLIAGAYQLGFLAVRRSSEASAFLDWWNDRLRNGCRLDVPRGLFTDQKWIDLVPSFFPSTAIFRDPSYNVAYWNLHERAVERHGTTFLVNGRELAFFHFSGFSPANPGVLTKHKARANAQAAPGTPLAELLAMYADLQMDAGFATSSRWGYAYSQLRNGTRTSRIFPDVPFDLVRSMLASGIMERRLRRRLARLRSRGRANAGALDVGLLSK